MASSSSVPESTLGESTQGTFTQKEAPAYEIRRRTMFLEEWELTVQVERAVDFASLLYHGYEIKGYYESQDLIHYFNILNGPTYENLVKHLWVRASVYDKNAAKLEEAEKC